MEINYSLHLCFFNILLTAKKIYFLIHLLFMSLKYIFERMYKNNKVRSFILYNISEDY